MAFYTNQWTQDNGFILGFDNNKVFEYLYTKFDYHNFFGRWYYLYGSYNSKENYIYFATYLSAEDRWLDSKTGTNLVRN